MKLDRASINIQLLLRLGAKDDSRVPSPISAIADKQ
jgi:hypothetical protein